MSEFDFDAADEDFKDVIPMSDDEARGTLAALLACARSVGVHRTFRDFLYGQVPGFQEMWETWPKDGSTPQGRDLTRALDLIHECVRVGSEWLTEWMSDRDIPYVSFIMQTPGGMMFSVLGDVAQYTLDQAEGWGL